MPLTWKDWQKQTVTSGGTGALTLGAAVSGFQAFGAGDDGKTFPYSIQDGTATETGRGAYTHAGTSFARTSRTYSSTGSALNVTTAAFLFVDMISTNGQNMDAAQQSKMPGGRLTLTTAVPATTSDVTAATTVYYTPYVGNTISLWDGNWWQSIIFAEVSLALGTLTNAQGYDVFGFLNAGALNTELLAWTNNTTRATTVTLQDGRYCKNGDKTRLYLGSFLTTATTTTEDSFVNRYLFNMYNRVHRASKITSNNTHTYNSVTERNWNNSATDTACNCMIGIVDQVIMMNGYGRGGDLSAGVSPVNNIIAIRLNSTTYNDTQGQVFFFTSASGSKVVGSTPQIAVDVPILGLNTLIMREIDGSTGGSGSTFTSATTMMKLML